MAELYFKKESIERQIFDKHNAPIQFENVAGGDGVVKVDESNVDLLAGLNDYADKRIGGVVRISAEIYDALKKNSPPAMSQRPSPGANPLNRIRTHQNPDPFRSRPATSAVAAGSKPVIMPPTDQDPPAGLAAYKARIARASSLGGIRANKPQ